MAELAKLMNAVNQGDLESVKTILQSNAGFINEKDAEGATALHYAAFAGHRKIVEFLLEHGANINAQDGKFGATPTGWAIEYLRESGGFLGIELSDFAYAIQQTDVAWVKRFLARFPTLREASDTHGISFRSLAEQSGNLEIIALFA